MDLGPNQSNQAQINLVIRLMVLENLGTISEEVSPAKLAAHRHKRLVYRAMGPMGTWGANQPSD